MVIIFLLFPPSSIEYKSQLSVNYCKSSECMCEKFLKKNINNKHFIGGTKIKTKQHFVNHLITKCIEWNSILNNVVLTIYYFTIRYRGRWCASCNRWPLFFFFFVFFYPRIEWKLFHWIISICIRIYSHKLMIEI